MSTTDRREDALFAEFQAEADAGRRGLLLASLIHELQNHAAAVCWQKLQQRRPDIVNEAVFKAVQKFDSFRGESKFSTWFQTVATNVINDSLRYEMVKAEMETPLDENLHSLDGSDPTMHHISRLTLEKLARKLTEDERQFLQDKINLSSPELCEKYHISPEGVRQKWHRLKMKLSSMGVRTVAALPSPPKAS